MDTVIQALRKVLGTPDFWRQLPNNSGGLSNYQWDYAAMIEYLVAALLLLIVVSSVFKILVRVFK